MGVVALLCDVALELDSPMSLSSAPVVAPLPSPPLETRNLMRGNGAVASGAGVDAGVERVEEGALESRSVLRLSLRDALAASSFSFRVGFVCFGRGAAGLRGGAFGTVMPWKGFRHFALPTSFDRYHTGPFGRVGPSKAFG